MTRINLVPPSELHSKHLVAEYRELPRVFALARPDAIIPAAYCLGTGHVTFFYDKLAFLYHRQFTLVNEMKARGYSPMFVPYELWKIWFAKKRHLWGDYTPTFEALALNRQRIAERQPKVA